MFSASQHVTYNGTLLARSTQRTISREYQLFVSSSSAQEPLLLVLLNDSHPALDFVQFSEIIARNVIIPKMYNQLISYAVQP